MVFSIVSLNVFSFVLYRLVIDPTCCGPCSTDKAGFNKILTGRYWNIPVLHLPY